MICSTLNLIANESGASSSYCLLDFYQRTYKSAWMFSVNLLSNIAFGLQDLNVSPGIARCMSS
jgi:hypothetical protein